MNRQDAAGAAGSAAGRAPRDSGACLSLAAAYREGLGLAAIAVTSGPAGIRIVAAARAADALAAAETVLARWWCRRGMEAERVAIAATARLRRCKSRDAASNASAPAFREPGESFDAVALACECVTRSAKQLNIVLHADGEVFDDAMAVVARINGEIERLRQSGGLKSLNKSYQKYRIETSERGGRALRYQDWMHQYTEGLVRELASTMRYF